MINNPIVFVLGAGASAPYGFPLGHELRRDLCGLSEAHSSWGNSLRNILCSDNNIPADELINFGRVFRGSNTKSIDSFLAIENNKKYIEIGKLAIAARIGLCENEGAFGPDVNDDWYCELWSALHAGATNASDLQNNKIKIITFNYDLSLEKFLHLSIKNTYGIEDEEAYAALKNIPILHVYGSLGNLGVGKGNRVYKLAMDVASIRAAANGIKIIPESRNDDPAFEKARDWFNWASRICFLGFGFDELNIKRLGLKDVIDSKEPTRGIHPPMVISSTFGMTDSQIELARSLLGVDSNKWYRCLGKSLQTILEHVYVLR
jgi:hypothetical protein